MLLSMLLQLLAELHLACCEHFFLVCLVLLVRKSNKIGLFEFLEEVEVFQNG